MPSKTGNARSSAAKTRSDQSAASAPLPSPTLTRRAAWVLALGVWLFLFISLASFDTADPPSHAVAVWNSPVSNLCGRTGAVVAYYAYEVLGIGSWMALAGLAIYLCVTVTGRVVNQPITRLMGLLIMTVGLATLHGLVMGGHGPLVGARSGLIAQRIVDEMQPRFAGTGSFLIVLVAFGLGAVLAMDHAVFSLPRWTMTAIGIGRQVPWPRLPKLSLPFLRQAQPALEGLGDVEAAPTPERVRKGRKIKDRDAASAIDPDAGGVGAVESFDPEEHEIEAQPREVRKGRKRAKALIEIDELDETEEVDPNEETREMPAIGGRAAEADSEDEDGGSNEPSNSSAPPSPAAAAVEPKSAAGSRQKLSADELRAKIARLPVRMAGQAKVVARDEDIPRAEEDYQGYRFPTLDLLGDPESNYSEKQESFVRQQAQQLEEALNTYGIDGEVVGIESGPVVTLYSVQLAPGTKVAKVTAIASDLARALSAQNIRIVANMVGKTTVGIEVPNLQKERVRLKELMSGGHAEKMVLPMFLGKDASGEPLVADLTRMPHMLIAGTTGSGKSVCMNTIIMSWLYTKRPDELKLVLVDPKMVEMSQFADIPHLMCPVVTEMSKAAAILEWAVNKMEERYELLREAMVRDIASYNALTEEEKYQVFQPANDLERAKIPKKLPYMVFIIDELADLMLTNKEVEHSIVRIAQKARAVGIHLILATQRPQANVVTGLIKSNMPCRVSFKVSSGMDSRIVLDQKGAELLLGQGDMLFLTPSTSEVKRAQGTLVTDGETRKVAVFLKTVAAPTFERSLIQLRAASDADGEGGDGLSPAERDPMFDEAVKIMIESGRGSVSLLQRRLAIGYSRASRLVDQMGLAGILGDHKGSVAREVLITLEDWEQMKKIEEDAAKNGTLFQDSQDDDGMGEMSSDAPDIETMNQDDEGVPAEYDDEFRR